MEPRDEDRPEWDFGETGEGITMSTTESPELAVERREFVNALRECAEHIPLHKRRIWFFRVFYGMHSKDIAAHPNIRLKVNHVDVLLKRTREAIRKCMSRRGFEPEDMPPGCFAELWTALEPERAVAQGA